MFKRELRVNFKSFIIWTIILIGIFLLVFLVYPSITRSDNIKYLNQAMEMFPEELLKAFNMDISGIDSAFGWLKTEGFILVLLITGIYSSIIGANILLKEESDKTIEYINSLPISRTNILLSKVGCGILYIVLLVLSIAIFNYIGLTLSGKFDSKTYLLLSITPLFSSLTFFSICLFISTFFHKTKKIVGISIGILFISYFFNILSELSSSTEPFKYISIFTLADIRNVIINSAINPLMILITLLISTLFIILTIIHYNKKELI